MLAVILNIILILLLKWDVCVTNVFLTSWEWHLMLELDCKVKAKNVSSLTYTNSIMYALVKK